MPRTQTIALIEDERTTQHLAAQRGAPSGAL
jgi:hypothetical protein